MTTDYHELETADRYRRIVEAVTGDPWYFRCVKPCPNKCKAGKLKHLKQSDGSFPGCPTCSGHGVVFREWLPCPACDGQGEHPPRELSGLPTRCLNCEGGRVPDVEGRERIQDACCRWLDEDSIFDAVRPQWWGAIKDSLDVPPIATWAWDNRHNQPWQTAIEQYVEKHVGQPDNLAAGDTLEQLLREAKIDVQLHLEYDGHCHAVLLRNDKIIGRSEYQDSRQAALLVATEAAFGLGGVT